MSGLDEDELLSLAGEFGSDLEHPLAECIQAYAVEEGSVKDVQGFRAIPWVTASPGRSDRRVLSRQPETDGRHRIGCNVRGETTPATRGWRKDGHASRVERSDPRHRCRRGYGERDVARCGEGAGR